MSRRCILDPDYVPAPDPLRYAAPIVCGKLDQACRNEHPEFALDGALASIAGRCDQAPDLQLSERARDEILLQLSIAKTVLPAFLSDYPRDQLIRGLEAVEFQVVVWAESAIQRMNRPRHTLADANDRARIFRNDMNSRCLREAIEDRAYARRADEIEAMIGKQKPQLSEGIFG